MSIQDQLTEDLKTAMKAKDDVTKDSIRWIKAAIQNAAIQKGSELDDAGVTDVMARMSKQFRDSITMYQEQNRDDLVSKEQAQLAVLMRYLPEQMSREDVETLVRQVIQETGASGPQEKGKVMGKLMPQVKGKADGSVVNQVVSELLGA